MQEAGVNSSSEILALAFGNAEVLCRMLDVCGKFLSVGLRMIIIFRNVWSIKNGMWVKGSAAEKGMAF